MILLLANDGNRVAVRGHIIVRRGPCPALIRSHTTTRLPPSVGGGESPEREPTVARKAPLLRSDRVATVQAVVQRLSRNSVL